MARSLVLGSLALTLATLIAPPAFACGDPTHDGVALGVRDDSVAAAELVQHHFELLAAGEAKAVRKLWAKDAKIRSFTAEGTLIRSRALRPALKRWLRDREGMTWTIESTALRFDGDVDVQVTVTWNGATYDDKITVHRDDRGRLVIVAKDTFARPAPARKAASPYS